MTRELCQKFVALRRNHPAWLLLASPRAPLMLSCLKQLFEENPNGIAQEEAIEQLAETFSAFINESEFELGDLENHAGTARKELRHWLKRRLIVEREGRLLATDALQRALAFLEGLEDQAMTSTASRLATVQREIEVLEARLNPSQGSRAKMLKEKMAALREELEGVERGDFEVLEGQRAEEGLREVYQLAVSLRADFRRVEDSYREADRELRQRIISDRHHRGEIVDELLEGHEALVETPEGQVFEGFHEQLVDSAELERMKARLRAILEYPATDSALERKQKAELRLLVPGLVKESERVIQARARSERDVRGFLKAGLADEQLRVGAILQELLEMAMRVDWKSQKLRREPSPLPPVAVAIPNLPVVVRLLVKESGSDAESELDLSAAEGDPMSMDDEFWQAYRALDRVALYQKTIAHLKACGRSLTLKELAEALPPIHDLETLTYWLAMAREAGINVQHSKEEIDLFNEEEGLTRFRAPVVEIGFEAANKLRVDQME